MHAYHICQDTRLAVQENGAYRYYIYRKNQVVIVKHTVCNFVMPYTNGTKFIMEVPSTWGRPHSKFDYTIFFWCTSNQTFEKFPHFFPYSLYFFLLTNAYSNLAEIWNTHWGSKGKSQHQIWSKFAWQTFPELWTILRIKIKSNFSHAYKLNQ